MHFYKGVAIGLLALATGPFQTLVAGRSVELKAPLEVSGQGIVARAGWDKPRIKISQVFPNQHVRTRVAIQPQTKEAIKISPNTMWVKTEGEIANELRVYESIDRLQIAPPFLAIIEADNSHEIVGFILENIIGKEAELEDKGNCETALNRLHNSGWAHGDAHKKNFIVTPDKTYIVDFEKAVGVSEDLINKDFQMLDQELPDFGNDDDNWSRGSNQSN